MSVKKDASGRRWVEVQVEVPGTPEEVWQAIATGPGVSSWFVPTEVEEGESGAPVRVVSHFSPDGSMDSIANVTAWDPPRRFVADSPEDLGPDAPVVATEWIVDDRSGGTCVVRVVHSLFASSDDWDNQLQMWEFGWPDFFRILKLYLTHFRGQRCSALQLMRIAHEPASQAWDLLTGSLGFAGATVGERRSTPPAAPPLAGLVERTGEGEDQQLLLRLDEPTPGIAHLFVFPMGGQVYITIRLYLYGDRAAAAVARDETLWHTWMNKRFPAVGDSSNVT